MWDEYYRRRNWARLDLIAVPLGLFLLVQNPEPILNWFNALPDQTKIILLCGDWFDDALLCNPHPTMGGVAMPALRGKVRRTKVQYGAFDDRAASLAACGRLDLQVLRSTLRTGVVGVA
jgi:hypothetical protein